MSRNGVYSVLNAFYQSGIMSRNMKRKKNVSNKEICLKNFSAGNKIALLCSICSHSNEHFILNEIMT